ncbi:MAG: hypothetical protein PHU49_16545 [Syntrophorhabdaceae bacterium]|nr:hypothetical protein [Syntrophorhabdaceae bacterium]
MITIDSNAIEVAESMGAKVADLRKAIHDTMKTVEREAMRDFRRPTSSWHHHPKFESLTEERGNGFTLIVGTDDAVYNMLDKGTPPHKITPKGPGYPLAFTWGGPGSYHAQTQPNSLDSWGRGGTGAQGGARFFMSVNHPGTKKRGWSKLVFKSATARARNLLEDKIAAIIQKVVAAHPLRRPSGF